MELQTNGGTAAGYAGGAAAAASHFYGRMHESNRLV